MIRSLTPAAKGALILRLFPPIVLSSLLEEDNFRIESGLESLSMIKFGDLIEFQRAPFFEAIRKALSGNTEEIADEHSRIWKLFNCAIEETAPRLKITTDDIELPLPDMSVLSEVLTTRTKFLKKVVQEVGLPRSDVLRWRTILKKRPLTDEEYEAFDKDLRNTPVEVAKRLGHDLRSSAGRVPLTTFVPHSAHYYERLIGAYDGSRSVEEYARRNGRKHLERLSKWNPYDGFLFSLLLSAHSMLTSKISVDSLSSEELHRAYTYVDQQGDTLSRLGALEIGLRVHAQRPEVEPFLLPLLHKIRDDNTEETNSRFKLFSALFILVDGELARIHLFGHRPPFYRRLASLAQAALIERIFFRNNKENKKFTTWALAYASRYFYVQSLVDLRIEPRWTPDFAAPDEIQAEFIGRILTTGRQYQDTLAEGDFRETIIGEGVGSLAERWPFPRPFLPGPLEGTKDKLPQVPHELADAIRKQLEQTEPEASSFLNLSMAAMFFDISTDQASMAAQTLRAAKQRLANLAEKSQLTRILRGLATTAAISQNRDLADEVRLLARVYRNDAEFRLSIEESLSVCLMASASLQNPKEWNVFVGEWLTELAFGDLTEEEGNLFQFQLHSLLHVVPELWGTCSRAEAALDALCHR